MPPPAEAEAEAETDPAVVRGVRCRDCGRVSCLPQRWCAWCRGTVEATVLSGRGTVWSVTTVHFPVEGLEAPYRLAYVDLDEGARVLVRIDGEGDDIVIGGAVALAPLPGDPHVFTATTA